MTYNYPSSSWDRYSHVSVIVPVYNDLERLDMCLKALLGQTYPQSLYEIIVVDNGSDVSPCRIVQKYSPARLVSCNIPGSYNARNEGINYAQGEILAFTDADCIPEPEWIEHGVHALQNNEKTGLVGGRIRFFFQNTHKPRIIEIYDSITYLQQHDAIYNCKFAATANAFTWKWVMHQVGYFNTSYKSAGDRDWGERVARAGLTLIYAPDSVVLHPARESFAQLHKRNLRIHGGHHQLHAQERGKMRTAELCREILTDLAPPLRFALRIFSDNRVRGVRTKILVTGVHMLNKFDRAQARVRYQCGLKPTRS